MAGDDAVSPITGAAVNGVTPVNVNGAVYGLPIGAEGYDVMSNSDSEFKNLFGDHHDGVPDSMWTERVGRALASFA